MVYKDMFCSWQQRKGKRWQKYSGWADLSGNTPRLNNATLDMQNDR